MTLQRLALLVAGLCAVSARADYMDHFVVRDDVGPHKAPYLGNAELLVIPVEVAGYPPFDVDLLNYFFSAGDPDGFVKYYQTASLGRYQPHVTVGPVITYDTCPLPAAQFPNCKVARGDIAIFGPGLDLVRDVVKKSKEQGIDFSKLDVNGRKGSADGFVDGVMILTNVSFGGIAFPFAYFNRGDNLNGGTGGPLIVDNTRITHVAIAGDSDRFVMVHEFGHVLGLTDLYSNVDSYEGLFFSQMGNWYYDPAIPLPDAETRLRLRWSNWHQVKGKRDVKIAPAEAGGEVWKMGNPDEYFLVENRGPGGAFDQAFTTRGLVVYHVDRRVKLNGEEGRFQDRVIDYVNSDPWHSYISNVQGDGKFDIQNGARSISYPDDLFRDGDTLDRDATETPIGPDHQVVSSNWYSGKVSNVAISNIKVRADGYIEATLEGPQGDCETICPEGDGCIPITCGDQAYGPEEKACGCGASGGGLSLLALALSALRRALRRR